MKALFRLACCLPALLVLFALAPVRAQDGRCPQAPKEPLDLGETLRLGESAYRVHLEAHQPEGAADWNTLDVRLDLVVRSYDPVTREMGPNTQPLSALGSWTWTDGILKPVAGRLAQRVSAGGTALGFDISVPRPVPSDYVVTFLIEPPDPDLCETIDLRFAVPATAIESSVMPSGQAAGIRSPSNNHHMNLLSQIDLRPSESTSDIWGYYDGATYLALQGSYSGTIFVDVTDPYNPVEVGFVAGPNSSWRDIKTYQNYAYIVTEGAGPLAGMQIVDLSDPLNPTLVNTYSTNFVTTHNIWIDPDRGHAWLVGTDQGTRILDLSDPVNPVELGSYVASYVHDIYVKDNIAFMSKIFNGVHDIRDATNPPSLPLLSSWSTPDNFTHNSWPNEDFSLLVTSDEEEPGGHLTVYDISNPNSTPPKLSEYIPNAASLIHNAFFDDIPGANRVVMSHYALGVRYVDLQRPSMPVELGSYDTRSSTDSGFSGCWGVYPFDPRGYIYASDIQSGLFVFELAPSGGALTGIVRDAATQLEIAGASVLSLSDSALFSTNTRGEFGGYVDAGSVVVRVTAPGYQSKVVAAGTMTLGGGVDTEIDLLPLPTATITGTAVSSTDQVPIQGAVVSVIDTTQSATTDASGAFTINDVAIGQRVVSVDSTGFAGDETTVELYTGEVENVAFTLAPALNDDLETDTGWTVDPADTAITGNWVRNDPNGTADGSVNPEDDHTPPPGVKAYFTGQGIAGERTNPEIQDVDGGTTRLLSPVVDLSGQANATFCYHRWFSNNAGALSGGTMRVEVSDDAGSTWTTVELLNTNANHWIGVEIQLSDYISINDQFQARFSCEAIVDMDQQRILECAIDDIEMLQECRARAVPGGTDSDFDGWLDPCDPCPFDPVDDIDADGLCGDVDNAPFVANPGQADGDGDGIGDAADNCVNTGNTGQLDLDLDGEGDACDPDRDGDGIENTLDTDNDNDGVLDVNDICPYVQDAMQVDFDADMQGDACDADDGLVHGVRLNEDLITWQAETGATAYNIYTAELGAPVLIQFGACRASGIGQTSYVDTKLPEPGGARAYLITAVVSGIEQGWGNESDGTARLVNEQCP